MRPVPPPILIHQQYNPIEVPGPPPPPPHPLSLPPEPMPNALAVPVFELIEANPKNNE